MEGELFSIFTLFSRVLAQPVPTYEQGKIFRCQRNRSNYTHYCKSPYFLITRLNLLTLSKFVLKCYKKERFIQGSLFSVV